LAEEALGQSSRALRDYDQALRLDPRLGAAFLNRGILHYRERRYAQALADLQRALETGAAPAVVSYNQVLVRQAEGNRTAARASRRDIEDRLPGQR
jgi:tetratricopeptide (TPR) repeat protein